MDGLLLVDKPEGISSFGVVAKVRRIILEAQKAELNPSRLDVAQGKSEERANSSDATLSERQSVFDEAIRQELAGMPGSARQQGKASRRIKIGHCGTLDPAASGLMLIVIGKYTKRAQEFSKLDKTYEAEVTLGATSTTADREGELTQISKDKPTNDQVTAVLKSFIGEIMQTPPIYSAIKIDGQRAYKMARAGKEVKMEPRKATIYGIDKISYNYPKITFTVSVSSGTYIRSLAEDIGNKLEVGAYLSSLRRTAVGDFDIDQSVVLQDLNYDKILNSISQGL